jgi:hypothetical protein
MLKSSVFENKILRRDFTLAFIVLISPFLFYLYRFSPKNSKKWDTIFFEINLNLEFYEIDDIFWYLSYEALFILILSIWYITCQHKWRLVILVPLVIEFHKLVGYFFEINNSFSHYKINHTILVSMVYFIILTYLSTKLNYYSYSKSISQQIDSEIETLNCNVLNFNKRKYKVFQSRLIQLRKMKKHLNKKEYLIKLIKLREEFNIENDESSI